MTTWEYESASQAVRPDTSAREGATKGRDGRTRSMIPIEIADVTIFYNYCGSETSVRSFSLLARRRVVVTSCNRRLQAQGSPARRPPFSATRNLDAQDLSGPSAEAVVLLPGGLKAMASLRRLARMLAQLESEGIGGISDAVGEGIGTATISDRKCVTRRAAPVIGSRDHGDGVLYARPPRARRRL